MDSDWSGFHEAASDKSRGVVVLALNRFDADRKRPSAPGSSSAAVEGGTPPPRSTAAWRLAIDPERRSCQMGPPGFEHPC